MPVFVSTHSLPLSWALSLYLPCTETHSVCMCGIFFLFPLPMSLHSDTDTSLRQRCGCRVDGQPVILSIGVSESFPATPGCVCIGGEWFHSLWEERQALLRLSPVAGAIQISSVGVAQLCPYPVNPLRASAQHALTQRQKAFCPINDQQYNKTFLVLHIF